MAVLSARTGATITQLIHQAIAEYLATQDLASLDAAARAYNERTLGNPTTRLNRAKLAMRDRHRPSPGRNPHRAHVRHDAGCEINLVREPGPTRE
jgi:hypothetical protein